ncbi:MAG: 16S rRNA (guanine527-N7)-methyltransferase [Pseudohongiellaceae bacterium]|jgi:16S rRNA (guanine527-N7)-methyltransferase
MPTTANPLYRQVLLAGIDDLSLSFTEQTIDKFLVYHQLLIKWNKAYNLTAVRDPLEMVGRHLLDSLSICQMLDGQRFIDVGAGAGLPGIVLAIAFPERQFDLLDSNGKKTRFLFQAKTELALGNIEIHHSRVEQYQVASGYDGVLSRAFANLADMVNTSEQLLAEGGYFYAMKGIYPEQELKQLSELPKSYKVEHCYPLQVPGESAERHLVVIRRGN